MRGGRLVSHLPSGHSYPARRQAVVAGSFEAAGSAEEGGVSSAADEAIVSLLWTPLELLCGDSFKAKLHD
ncbi:hypothetical protein ARSEF4850_010153, partial [Beauveria asiatica]